MFGGRPLGLFPALLALVWTAASSAASASEIPVVELTGVVHAVSANHVVAALDRADAEGAPLVVLRIDTPGGLDTSMRQIVDRVLRARTPVAVFVGPSGARAASAGFVIAMAADFVAMAPGTNLGAAHPVGGMSEMDDVMAKKVTSDAAAYVRGKVERRGRNVDLAEKAVTESRSFTEKEALDGKLIELVVGDVPALIAALDGRELRRFDGTQVALHLKGLGTRNDAMNGREAALSLIARPDVLFLLLLGALAGLGAELSHPGAILPGIVGVFCLILFLFATQVLPINWTGVVLIVLAIGLFAVEVKVVSHGLLTVAGIAAMILGALMLMDAPGVELKLDMGLVLPAVMVVAAMTFTLVRLAVTAQARQPTTGEAGLIGQPAVADTEIGPEGFVRVMGERWRAVADEPIAVGEAVRILSTEGLTLHVRKGA